MSETAGLLGQNNIIRLGYDVNEDSAPGSLFAKFALADAGSRAHWRTFYMQEVLFYQRFSDQIELRTPRSYFSQFDGDTGYFLLLLEDCSHAEVGDRLVGCSLERARLAVKEIAKFHAAWWNDLEAPHYRSKFTDEAFLYWQTIYAEQVKRLDEISEIPRDAELIRTLKELSPQLVNVMRYQRTKPYTFIHHDYHLSNLIFT